MDAVEKRIFERTRTSDESNLGIIRESYIARSTDQDILKIAQDGGVVTSLLAHAIDKGLVDYTVGAFRSSENPWRPEPAIMKSREQLLRSAGTKCSPSASLSGVTEAALGYPDSKLAFVGLPCQIQALRRVLTSPQGPRKFGESVHVALGLFCNNSYHYNKLAVDYLKTQRQISLQAITKMRLDSKDDRFRVYEGEKTVVDNSAKEIEPYLLGACSKCNDFTSELADVSVGAHGASEGWCTVLVRTETGERLFKSAIENGIIEAKPLAGMEGGLSGILETASKKKKREARYITHET